MICRNCGGHHFLNNHDAGSYRETENLCKTCSTKLIKIGDYVKINKDSRITYYHQDPMKVIGIKRYNVYVVEYEPWDREGIDNTILDHYVSLDKETTLKMKRLTKYKKILKNINGVD